VGSRAVLDTPVKSIPRHHRESNPRTPIVKPVAQRYSFKKALTVLRGPLAYPNGILDLYIETFGRTLWPRD
jgi:hypothetical protein